MAKNIYSRLLKYTFKHKGLFSLSIIGFIIFAAADISAVEWLKRVISYINNSNQSELLSPISLALFLLVVSVLRGIGFYMGNFFMANVGLKVVHNLREELISSLIYQPMSFFDLASKGEIVNRIIFTTNQITGAATNALKILAKEGLLLIGLFIYLLYLSWKLTVVVLVITPLIAVVVSFAGKRMRRVARKIQEIMGLVTQVSNEIATGAREIKSFNNEDGEKDRFKKANDENLKQNLKMESTLNLSTPLIQVFVAFSLALMSYLALSNLDELNLPSESFVAFFTAAGLMARPIRQLSNLNAVIQRGLAAAEDIFNTIDSYPEDHESGIKLQQAFEGNVEIENVSFSYLEHSEPVLKEISISAKKGETIALVGRSGSGKSTIVNLLNRFYDSFEGKITIDGYDIRKVNLKDLREAISYVSQDPVLFNDTIRNNITYGLKEVTEKAIYEAAKDANAYEFITNLPDGFDTIIGDDGVLLSGGEKQRVAIARALLKKSSILIFDEATSALDNESEKAIQTAIEKASKNKTTFIIAHRLSSVEKADKICVIEDGRITQMGKHDDLMEQHGLYNKLQGKGPEKLEKENYKIEKVLPEIYVEKLGFWDRVGILNILLLPISFLYWFSISIKDLFNRRQISSVDEVPVIVVGNVSAGGNGKTPLVNQIAKDLRTVGYKPTIVLRGYKGNFNGTVELNDDSDAKQVGDEAIFHYNRGFPVVVDRDRTRAVSYAQRNINTDIVISDDGLQHHGLRRDFEIIVEDSRRDFGNGLFIPAGPLRDKRERINKTDLFLYSGRNKDNVDFFELEPASWVNIKTGDEFEIEDYPFGTSANLISGIAKPERFLNSVSNLGISCEHKFFPDHHYFSENDIKFDFKRAILMTEKDAVRMEKKLIEKNMWFLKMRVKLNVNITKLITDKLNERKL